MTVAGHRRLADLPADLAATVRARVGYPVSREDVLATAPVRDAWEVLGMRETAEERLTTRRTWLRGRRTGRPALVLSFAAGGQALDARLVPGTAVEAGLHFYPGAGALRALVAEERGEPEPLRGIAGESVEAAHARLGHAVAADPWVSEWPVVLAGVVPTPGPGESEGPGWTLRDRAGDVVALQPWSAQLWRLLAVSGGRPVTVAGVLAPWGLRPLAAHDGGAAERLVLL